MLLDFESIPIDEVLFDLVPGVTFTSLPRVTELSSGEHALTNAQPGEEFNRQPLRMDFTLPQRRVSLLAGMSSASSVKITATMTAFDGAGAELDSMAAEIGPGPVPPSVAFAVEVQDPSITRVELKYSGAFSELVDDIEFDVVGPAVDPDVTPPSVRIIRPRPSAVVYADSTILRVEIDEDRRLESVSIDLASDATTRTFSSSFSGSAPSYSLGPVRVLPLELGLNAITVSARDFGGNEGSDTVRVVREPIKASLVVDRGGPIVLERLETTGVGVHLEEAVDAPGALSDHGRIDVRVTGPTGTRGESRIASFISQPSAHTTVPIFTRSPFGKAAIEFEAIDVETDRLIDRTQVVASIVPPGAVDCADVPYVEVTTDDRLRVAMEQRIDQDVQAVDFVPLADDVTTLDDLKLTIEGGELRVSRRFGLMKLRNVAGLDVVLVDVNFSATIVRQASVPASEIGSIALRDDDDLPFVYGRLHVNANPKIPVVDIATAFAWRAAQRVAERRFRSSMRPRLARGFQNEILARLTSINPQAAGFLTEMELVDHSLRLTFCLNGALSFWEDE